ncbi:MAG TPA: restriction endonuclease subunit S [Methylococcaceae bacterium]|nr:restriction endonuclease subunit S [Methylococcaceae bacterium]
MKYGLTDAQLQEIIAFIEQYSEVEQAILFGSRAMGTFKEASDVDIAIKGEKVTDSLAQRIKFDIEEDTYLPFFFDVIAYPSISNETLIKHIDDKGVVIFRRWESEWRECKLGEQINLKRGYDLPNRLRQDGDIPIFSSSGVTGFHNEKMCDAPGVITGRYGTIGQIFFSKKPYWPLNTTLYVQDFKGNDELFVYYFLKRLDWDKYSDKSAVPGVNRNDVHQEEVELPPLSEQKAIAAVLSSLDDKIDLLHRQNLTLEAMAETLFRQWFIEEAGEDWANTVLEKHTDAYRGLSYKGSGLSDVGLGLPMHNLNSVYEGGGYKEDGIKYYSGEVKDRHFLKAGDIIIANTEQGHEFKLIGFPAIVPAHFGDTGIFSQHIYRLIPKIDSYLTTEYLYYLLMTKMVREQVISATNGSTVNMLSIDGLQRPEFRLPPKERIAEFTAIVKSWWKKKEVNQSQIQTLEKLRDTLLPKLMSGEVRVKVV